MSELLFYAFFISILCSGVACILFPEAVVAWRKKHGLTESILSGGYFYASPRRARWTGVIVTVLAVAVLLMKYIGGK